MKVSKLYIPILLIGSLLFSCTKLNENLYSELEEAGSAKSVADLLTSTYSSLNGPYQQDNRWALQEITSDEAMAPTRGGDWDDNGIHRALHLHLWNADNSYMENTFNGLGNAIFQASNVLRFDTSPQQAAEAKFIRSLAMFDMLDLWGQVPYRESLDSYKQDPKVLKGQEAIDFILADLNAAMKDLPGDGAAYVANKNAARVLLMKLYLNKGVFLNRASPTFSKEDMNQVISLAKEITKSGLYTISAPGKYFDNFAPNNDKISTEDIFTLYNENGVRGGSVDRTWNTVAHYNMLPGGWNGWCTLSDFYDKFESKDERRGIYYKYDADTTKNGTRPIPKQNVGMFYGQQYNWNTDKPLMARNPSTAPLFFTKEVTLRTSGATLETAGIRPMKYAYDYSHNGQKNNDWVVYRYSDVLMMEAEAMLRGGDGTPTEALALVNKIRINRGVAAFSTLTLDNLLDERGRELYWEGWRRQDLIRFGKFLAAWQEKPADASPNTLLFAIPAQQIASNPNLTQNPGF
ncbi:MAG TPA: RagB/SusD family nutrient uptake outer membrane protein [Arachidicoccus sp.]|nr:RagB/SusD family nutrient uptake outer membrane protein [Arachidicoccus sp.]